MKTSKNRTMKVKRTASASKIYLFCLLLLLTSACHQADKAGLLYDIGDSRDDEIIPSTRQEEVSPPPPPAPEPEEDKAVDKKKIIKDGSLRIRVEQLEAAKLRVDSLVKKYRGYYASENKENNNWESTYTLKVRVPGVSFESFVAAVEAGQGETEFKNIEARDVTTQFIDLESRLANKQNYLARYNDLLKKANSVKEILEIEEKIRAIEEEIESTTGRLKYLGDQVAYSSLELDLVKQHHYSPGQNQAGRFGERFKNSVANGWYGFVDFLLWAIGLWPFFIVFGFCWYLIRRFRRARKNKKQVADE